MARIALYTVAAIGMAISFAFGTNAAPLEPKGICSSGPVVTDGDTIRCGKTKIRAMGYDTAEKGALAKCDGERELAAKATARMKDLMGYPHKVTLRYAKGRDKYGRTLAWIYSDKKDVGKILIAEGLAHPYAVQTGKRSWCN